MKWTKQRSFSLLLLLVMLLCTGCWDKKEFNQLALAQVVAIDYTDAQYELTLQLVMPKASEENVSSESLWVINGKGNSVGDALEEIALRAPREIYLDHLDIVLLGETLMQHDIDHGLEYLLKQHVLRRRTKLLAVEGKAGDILQAKPELADVDIFYLSNLLKDQNRRMKGNVTMINDYYLTAGSALQDVLVIPKVAAKGEKELEINGGALLQEGVLLRWVNQEWMTGYRWITGGKEITTLPDAGVEQRDITLEMHKSKCDWELLSANPLRVRANMKGKLYVVENKMLTKNISLPEMELLNQQIQQEAQKQLTKQITDTLHQAQQAKGDAFGLGKWLYAWHPAVIDQQNWPQQFSQAEIEVNLETQIELFEYR